MPSQTLETNCRPASPFDAVPQFVHAVHAPACASGGSRSALRSAASHVMRVRALIVFGLLAVALIVSAALFVKHIRVPRVVGRAVAPDGTEMCIVQQCNWNAEPFTTSFVYCRPGTDWGWFYFDHQDWYWSTSRASLDTSNQVAVFYRDGSPAVTFAWTREIYTLHRWSRTLTGAQERLPAGWSPDRSVYSR